MKIVHDIVLLARDVPIRLPYGLRWTETQSEWKTWGVIGVHGHWNKAESGYGNKAESGYVCPMILYEPRGWMNVAREESPFYNRTVVIRDDKDAISGDVFEETVLNLQLDGDEKNVFEIPLKVVQILEKKSIEKYGRLHATSFVLPFKWLKTKCRRVI